MNESIRLKDGYEFVFETTSDVGTIANIDNANITIEIDRRFGQYYVNIRYKGVLIQIWCRKYEVRKIQW